METITRIDSSDGYQSVLLREVSTVRKLDEQFSISEVEFRGMFWDPSKILESEEFEMGPQYLVTAYSVVLSSSSLLALHHHLKEWQVHQDSFQLKLTPYGENLFCIAIDQSNKLISSKDKPVCTFRYDSPRFSGEWRMVVDQSCFRLMQQELLKWISR